MLAWRKRCAPTTIHLRALALKKLLTALGSATGRTELPAAVPRTPRGKPRTTIAKAGEPEAAMTMASAWLRLAIALCYYGALRSSDTRRVCPENYDRERRQIILLQKKTGDPVSFPVVDLLAAMLNAVPTDNPATPYLQTLAGRPVSYTMLSCAWQVLKRRAGINRALTLHDLRRTTCVALYEQGRDLRACQQMLGHRSIATTAEYLEHRDPEKLRPLLEQIWTPKGPVQ